MQKNLITNCKNKTIFVTGGAGFLGSEIVRQISA
jgi:FlaA1/EpsC-like NDP-sugar epimerase